MSKNNKYKTSFPEPRKEIKNMKAYSAPLENRRDFLRLDFNENTLGPSPEVYKAIQNIRSNYIAIYPEYDLLIEKVCERYCESKKLNNDQVGLFNGADAAINAIFNAFGNINDIFLTTNPTFGYYFPCAEMRGMKIITCRYKGNNFNFPIEDFEEKINLYKPKLIFICNPNNPTGTILDSQRIIEIANNNKESIIVVDELYEKFYGDSLLNKIDFDDINNIIIIQSLSKTGGLAGLRIGFAFGNKKLIKYINKVTGPYDINSFAVTATIAALDDKKYIDDYILEVKKAREWIKNKFMNLNSRSHFGGGNYFLIWPNKDPKQLVKEFKHNGILVRSMENKQDIEHSLRVSIGTKKQMQFFWEKYIQLEIC
tara:strand:- start:22229 stop:23335 length:1107 start_codon:yes stop_codon:yes gene_type:complete